MSHSAEGQIKNSAVGAGGIFQSQGPGVQSGSFAFTGRFDKELPSWSSQNAELCYNKKSDVHGQMKIMSQKSHVGPVTFKLQLERDVTLTGILDANLDKEYRITGSLNFINV